MLPEFVEIPLNSQGPILPVTLNDINAKKEKITPQCIFRACWITVLVLVTAAIAGAAVFAILYSVGVIQLETNHNTTASPTNSSKPRISNPLPFYYFPKVLNESVHHTEARARCEQFEGYTLAGLNTANWAFLNYTAGFIKSGNWDAVLTGGIVEISEQPKLIRWPDGRTTHSSMAPQGIFCDTGEFEKAFYRAKSLDKTGPLFAPLVRTKQRPNCLTLFTDHIFENDEASFPPLCVTAEAKLFIRDADDRIVLPKFFADYGLFDAENAAFTDIDRKLRCKTMHQGYCHRSKEDYETYKYAFAAYGYIDRPAFLVSYPQWVDYTTAEAICSLTRTKFENTPNGLIGHQILDSSTGLHSTYKFYDTIMRTMMDINDYQTPNNLKTGGEFDEIYIPTGAFFNFSSSNFEQLRWKNPDGSIESKEIKDLGTFEWCPGSDPKVQLQETYHRFKVWLMSLGKDQQTTGPHLLPVGISSNQGLLCHPCLKLITNELYWPGSQKWIPTCHLAEPPAATS